MVMSRHYHGRGKPPESPVTLPSVDKERMRAPEGYRASAGLAAAVDVAICLGMPLLLTGEPGSGKSQLARSVAWELGLGEPLRFVVKSDTAGQDLFYQFDTVGRFHAANNRENVDPRRFVRFNALGRAILHTYSAQALEPVLGPAFAALDHPGEPVRSVVLIDEIDKAPRDVPNDLLAEVEDMAFELHEIGLGQAGRTQFEISWGPQALHPIVIITSNSEKSLPDAFLRRCVYYNVPFPPFASADPQEITVQTIVDTRLGERYGERPRGLVEDAVSFFQVLREESSLDRKPGLAELLNWLDYLLLRAGKDRWRQLEDIPEAELALGVSTTLLKNRADQDRVLSVTSRWRARNRPAR